jgi:hypothetical protein
MKLRSSGFKNYHKPNQDIPLRTAGFSERPSLMDHSLIRYKSRGAVAQLGERLVRNEEASGSIPLSSTNPSATFVSICLSQGNLLSSKFQTLEPHAKLSSVS